LHITPLFLINVSEQEALRQLSQCGERMVQWEKLLEEGEISIQQAGSVITTAVEAGRVADAIAKVPFITTTQHLTSPVLGPNYWCFELCLEGL
jgi:hypothetical protein